ncbi:DinB family protein [Cryomorpha ignava]|uniref:DinB family protein n=1 Tax=Cryomorpha ignava TaxID=101383 RepID=A0A7K3WKJ9_9FLAO|nr:DinB family protein [Cryomorpha ignava]NEN22173.1 DinB family protein [Cryomorpha ignava]
MLGKLQKEFDSLNNLLERTLDFAGNLSNDKLHQSPKGVWSAAQIIYHLKESEKGTLMYLEKKIQSPKAEVAKGGISSKIRSFMLSRALRNYNKKFKAPSILGEMPEKPNFTEVRSEYLEVRKKMGLLLEKFDKDMLGRAYFKHPRAGRITILQTLEFLNDHLERHEDQIIERSS